MKETTLEYTKKKKTVERRRKKRFEPHGRKSLCTPEIFGSSNDTQPPLPSPRFFPGIRFFCPQFLQPPNKTKKVRIQQRELLLDFCRKLHFGGEMFVQRPGETEDPILVIAKFRHFLLIYFIDVLDLILIELKPSDSAVNKHKRDLQSSQRFFGGKKRKRFSSRRCLDPNLPSNMR